MKIVLNNMRFYAQHGCYHTEQKVGTRFAVDLSVQYDGTQAAESDDVQDALNYLDLYHAVAQEMATPSHILEHVARRILDRIGRDFPQALEAEVRVSKIAPPLGGDIESVTVCECADYGRLK